VQAAHPHRFPKGARLIHRRQFQAVFAQGVKTVGPHFVGYAMNGDGEACKLGIAVSRKVGNAVVRNRVKRQVREWFRTHRHLLRPGLQVVIVARASSATLRGSQPVEALTALARRWGPSA